MIQLPLSLRLLTLLCCIDLSLDAQDHVEAPANVQTEATAIEERRFVVATIGREITEHGRVIASLGRLLTPNVGTLLYDSNTSTLTVRDTPAAVEAIATHLKVMDVARPSVQIAVEFVRFRDAELLTGWLTEAGAAPRNGISLVPPGLEDKFSAFLRAAGLETTRLPTASIPVERSTRMSYRVSTDRARPTLDGGVAQQLLSKEIELYAAPCIDAMQRLTLSLTLRVGPDSRRAQNDDAPHGRLDSRSCMFQVGAASGQIAVVQLPTDPDTVMVVTPDVISSISGGARPGTGSARVLSR
jgi:hypothetical protein